MKQEKIDLEEIIKIKELINNWGIGEEEIGKFFYEGSFEGIHIKLSKIPKFFSFKSHYELAVISQKHSLNTPLVVYSSKKYPELEKHYKDVELKFGKNDKEAVNYIRDLLTRLDY